MAKIKVESQSTGTGIYTLKTGTASTNYSATLPDSTGTLINTAPSTSGNILTSDGTDWTSAAAAGGGLYASVAIICDQKVQGTASGTFTSGAWRTRDLNTEISDAGGIVSITSNQFTLAAGTYTIEWKAPAQKVNKHITKLYNITDASDVEFGSSAISHESVLTNESSNGHTVIVITGSKAFEIQHRCGDTFASEGFGGYANQSVEKFTIVKILKHS